MLSPGTEAGTPSFLVVFPSWEGIVGGDLNFRVLLPSGTLLRTNRPVEAWAVEINTCLLASCVCSITVPLLPSRVLRKEVSGI